MNRFDQAELFPEYISRIHSIDHIHPYKNQVITALQCSMPSMFDLGIKFTNTLP